MHLDQGLLGPRTGTATLTVGPADTAIAAGSGDLPVLATPRMIALMEQAACAALAGALPAEATSVGIHVDIRHLAPTAVGGTVTATAMVTSVDGARIGFEVRATHATEDGETEIGRGTHLRAVVDRAAFLARLR